jgi:hypothetical protein
LTIIQPPYPPQVATVGGLPTVDQDVPPTAVFLFLYIGGAVANMTIFQRNNRKGHKFIKSAAMFGFCMSRIVTCIMRIVWATRPTNARIAIAAQIFTNAGVLVVYIVAFILATRILRATQPRLGWSPILRQGSKVLYFLLFCSLVLTISFTIETFYTLDMAIRIDAMWIQRAAITYMLVFNLLSVTMLVLSAVLPLTAESENFGTGSMKTKQIILGVVLFLAVFISGFRAGTTWETARPISDPAWYHHKACFYIFNFTFEIVIIYLLALTRFDQRFWVPNGSNAPGHYSQGAAINEKVEKEEAITR